MVSRDEIVERLREIAMLLELQRGGKYKVRAFQRGASALEAMTEPIEAQSEATLLAVRGIGVALARQILELRGKGTSELLESLRNGLPTSVLELSQIDGIGLHALETLHREHGIESLEDLRKAAGEGRLRGVSGFGEAREARILAAIDKYSLQGTPLLVSDALRLVDDWKNAILRLPGAIEVHLAGALRRFIEVAREIDLVVTGENPDALIAHIASMPRVSRVEARSARRLQLRLADGARVNVVVCTPEELPVTRAQAIGSAGHVAKLAARAEKMGYRLAAHALYRGDDRVPIRDEAALYSLLGLAWIPPELREDRGEIEAAERGASVRLVELDDIRGFVHCHTTWSDGRGSVEEMARAAEARGASFLTITDHSSTAHYAGGLDIDRMKRQWDEIDEVQSRVGIRLLRGTESDILADGALDWPDAMLERLDIVIASIHNRYHQSEDEMTSRVLRAIRNPIFKIWGHPLGRLVTSRPPIPLRMAEVLDALAESRCAVEINGDPHRLDLEPRWARAAHERGVPFVLSVDAHSMNDFDNLRYAVHLARHAGLRAEDVLNTRDPAAFARAVAPGSASSFA